MLFRYICIPYILKDFHSVKIGIIHNITTCEKFYLIAEKFFHYLFHLLVNLLLMLQSPHCTQMT